MRTTVTINDDLLRRAKIEAAAAGRTLGEIVEDGLRLTLDRPQRTRERRALPTFGGSGTLPGVDLSDNAALRGLMDDETPLHALR